MKLDDKTAFEALQIGAASNQRYDELIRQGKLPHGWYWTRTMVAYAKEGEPFGKTVSFQSGEETWQVAVPKKYQGKANLVLLADLSPKEGRKEGNTITLMPKKITAKSMPEKDGYYLTDEFGFPSGAPSDSNNEAARKLWRRDNEEFVGLVSRGYGYFFGDGRRVVGAGDGPGGRYGVLVEDANTISNPNPDLKKLAHEAKKALDKMRGVVAEELLTPINKLVEAAKQ